MKCRLILFLVMQAVFGIVAPASQPERVPVSSSSSLSRTETLDDAKSIGINNLFNYFRNNGRGASNPFTYDNGLEYKPSARTVRSSTDRQYREGGHLMCDEGLVWGGYHQGAVKVGGATFRGGLQAGSILACGTQNMPPVAAASNTARYRIYRVRPDISSAVPAKLAEAMLAKDDLPAIVRYEPAVTARSLFEQYCADWNDWPGNEGAPFTDINRNGVYEPGIDIPGVPGADETLWYVANDLDSVRAKDLYGSLPIGIEMQKTIWAYHRTGALDNTIFQRSRLINKSGSQIDSMFVTQFGDPDVGDGYDDYAGCDTLRNIGFAYNGTDNDMVFGSHAPAVGFDMLAGPAVPGMPTDSAFVNFSFRKGLKNLPMTSFVYVNRWSEPTIVNSTGTLQLYNLMKGLTAYGLPFVNPETGRVIRYLFPGDPVLQSGWVEGDPYPDGKALQIPEDRRNGITAGPFTMAPSDTQDVVIAEIVGAGADRIASVASLLSNDDVVEKFFRNEFRLPATPMAPVVHVAESNGHIRLDWSDTASASLVESYASEGYRFQGYNVYQMPEGDFTRAHRLATCDLVDDVRWVIDTLYDPSSGLSVPIKTAFGTNSGLQRFYYTGWDSLSNTRMVNGRTYYYAVTSYAYSPLAAAGVKILESAPTVLAAIPQIPVTNTLADVQMINVYPNPYFAGNSLETNKDQHFVTFNHLPAHAVLHILTLNGVRVRVLIKNDPSQFLTWDLTNESGAPVGAGMYLVYIVMPDLGTQKILKLAVIPAVTVPDHW